MEQSPVRTVFDVITDFLAANPTPNEILAYHLPDDLQNRADYLLDRNSDDALTPDEHDEMQQFMAVDEMFALLKAKTKLRLNQQSL